MAKTNNRIVCIGGGHGLGRLLFALQDLDENLTGIVTTTDNGGSTGRLRQQVDTIAWGDLRNCLNQLCQVPGVSQLLFEYRFNTSGELNGHNLGNLMLLALEQLSLRPTDAIKIMRDLLQIKVGLFPMSDEPATLTARVGDKIIIGEVNVDQSATKPDQLALDKAVAAPHEVITTLAAADLIVLSPGSFMTSVMPTLLVSDIAAAINHSSARLVMMLNIKAESLGGPGRNYNLEVEDQLQFLEQVGVRQPDTILCPEGRLVSGIDDAVEVVVADLIGECGAMHSPVKIRAAFNRLCTFSG